MKAIGIPSKEARIYKPRKEFATKVSPEKEFLTAEELLERVIPRVEALFDKK
ncbi:hypothetical protein CLV62_12076 [Dysgonomonas alginatilytica]|uniref:Uncharacterized protein n=1 Tax=Dysgonomonas alginatilytica TaxID=1605892 RepID=A0A2V3PLB8_9BACT|nr:hypothetical protein [Dysgonomonas alginatilytica]PXV62387.1 hypothetical protein CLV62_12076 [Dysgonomonas alginatilytica]